LIVVLLVSSAMFSKIEAQGQATALFLRIPPSARAWGLGRSFVGLSDDIGSAYYNPSGLVNIEKSQMMLMYAPWLRQFIDDLHYSYLAWASNLKDIGHVAAHFTYLSLGRQEGTDEFGNPTGTFSSYELAFAISYGTYLSRDIALGGTFKYIHSHLANQGAGAEKGSGVGKSFAFDVGITYKVTHRMKLGASIVNIGPNMAYIDADQADPLPRALKIGIGYDIVNSQYYKLTAVFDSDIDLVGLGNKEDRGVKFDQTIFSGGAEFWYGESMALRAGYYYDKAGDVKSPTFGASIMWEKFQFDFGYFKGGTGHPLENQLLFSLIFRY